jgi:ferredoxin--NADP+ reductase
MPKILAKTQLSDDVFQFRVEAPLIAQERLAGQFIMLQTHEEFGERIPLTIADADIAEGSITLIFQAVGRSTQQLAKMEVGDDIPVIVGPLGSPTHVSKVGRVVCVGGGIGTAPMHPIVQAFKAAGNRVDVIIGARRKDLIILEKEMAALADNLVICTDDGSYGRKSLVTVPLKEFCEEPNKPDLVVAIGPPIMMKFCAETTRPYAVHTLVSLNTIMVDGTGMCGGCRVNVGGKVKFVCVDGPEFDGHLVDFDNMMQRLGAYKSFEKESWTQYQTQGTPRGQGHDCKIDALADEFSKRGSCG